MSSKTILVAGGAGFIGSHLCETLLDGGNKVICVDSFITSSRKNIKHLFSNPSFEFIEQNISKGIKVFGSVDRVYNLASPASPKYLSSIPFDILNVGSFGVKNLLDLCVVKKARFLQASTSEVYGSPLEHPQKESYWGNVNSIGIRSCYDESKRFAEAQIMAYNRFKGVETRIVRIFNTYGDRMLVDDGRVVPNFINQALEEKPLTVYGDGSQTRSFCYVSDLIRGLILLMESDYFLPVNIGSSDEVTVLNLAKLILKITGSKSRIVFREFPEDDPLIRKPDISVAKRELGWVPVVSLCSGLMKVIRTELKKS